MSIPHMAMKFSDEKGNIITVKVEPKVAIECYTQSRKVAPYSVSRPGKEGASLDLSFPKEKEATNDQDKGKALTDCHIEASEDLSPLVKSPMSRKPGTSTWTLGRSLTKTDHRLMSL